MEQDKPAINVGTLGHVDNGKSTLVWALTGVWPSRHSEETRRGITIHVGYADADINRCDKCGGRSVRSGFCSCGGLLFFERALSFVDCPGHQALMAAMMSGAAVMDGAILVVDANAKYPQARRRASARGHGCGCQKLHYCAEQD